MRVFFTVERNNIGRERTLNTKTKFEFGLEVSKRTMFSVYPEFIKIKYYVVHPVFT